MDEPFATSTGDSAWSRCDLAANPHEAGDKAERVQRMFTAIAGRYDLNNRLHSFGRDQVWRRATVRLTNPQPTDHVLDVACGTGDLAIAFARAGVASVVGVDFTEAMLELARAKTLTPSPSSKGRGESILTFEWADAMNLPMQDECFDIVSIAFGLRNVTDPDRVLREFRRVLRPGGRLAVLEFSQPRSRVARMLNRVYTHHIMPTTAAFIARDRAGAYRYLPRSVETFREGEAMGASLRQAGFAHVTEHRMTLGVCTAYIAAVR